ncbi:c-type cytochrome [Sulfuricurvum sp.]|uniref:c-type cytochrome n=1 Tax=Sulfuricurvum sp. TaxID=2025608 RepID=UPI0025F0384C|nr:c-type cytochrome [Sulfuricurvum sp.]
MKKVLIAVSVLLGLWSTTMADEGADLFKKCATCHGAQGEKAALGKSKIIKDMSSAQIITALKGYKDGTYGAASKAIMKGQVASLTDAQITALAAHISK